MQKMYAGKIFIKKKKKSENFSRIIQVWSGCFPRMLRAYTETFKANAWPREKNASLDLESQNVETSRGIYLGRGKNLEIQIPRFRYESGSGYLGISGGKCNGLDFISYS